jgi:hypothetical protein
MNERNVAALERLILEYFSNPTGQSSARDLAERLGTHSLGRTRRPVTMPGAFLVLPPIQDDPAGVTLNMWPPVACQELR